MKNQNIWSPIQFKLVKTLTKNGKMTRKELVKELGRPRTTIYDNLVVLQKQEVVEKFSCNNGKRGRPKVYWGLLK